MQTVPPNLMNPRARARRSLNGRWRTIVDPFGNGRLRQFQQDRSAAPDELVEYHFDSSDLLHVPGDWNSQRERLFFFEGFVWYKRSFQASPPPDGGHARLRFDAANRCTRAWLNGEPIGQHVGGFGPFEFDVGPHLREGENVLIVEVDNRRSEAAVPSHLYDWWNYGGITRDVALIELPATYVLDYGLSLAEGRNDRIEAWVRLAGAQPKQRVTLEIPELGVRADATTNAEGRALLSLDAPVELWSPESPRLYDVVVTCESDRVADRIGFRHIAVDGNEILLNGEPTFLRGISIHEEAPGREGRAWSEDDARTLLGWALDLGCNFVRLAHYPHNEHMARVADELGLLVWEEIPVYWAIQWKNAEVLDNAKQQLSEVIERDRNRASVIIWSIANETPKSDERLAFLASLAAHARELDSTRLVSAALFTHPSDELRYRVEDPLAEHLDVVAVNEYFGWYYGDKARLGEMRWEIAHAKPVIMSELGAGALAGKHGGTEEVWTEEFQADFYARQIAMLEKIPQVRGLTPWILKDFRAPIRTLPGIQDYYNRKGLVSERGQRKAAFDVLRAFYQRLLA